MRAFDAPAKESGDKLDTLSEAALRGGDVLGVVVPASAPESAWVLREGDHLVVVAVDRLGRSVREVATAVHELTSRGVHVRSLREGVDTSTPTGRAVTSIMATIAELELELGKERRAASREARVARGPAATKPMKPLPVNVMVMVGVPDNDRLAQIGFARISYGATRYVQAMNRVQEQAARLQS